MVEGKPVSLIKHGRFSIKNINLPEQLKPVELFICPICKKKTNGLNQVIKNASLNFYQSIYEIYSKNYQH